MTEESKASATVVQGNEQFLRALVGDKYARAWVAGFGSWTGGFAHKELRHLNPKKAAYVAAAFQKPGSTARSNRNFESGWLVVLDDVGTKIDKAFVDEFAPEPTYVIETSEGNFQYGFVLTEPVYDVRKWNAFYPLMKETEFAGAADNSGWGAYKRLPFGLASKPGKEGFVTRLTHWAPDVRYSIDELANALGFDLSEENVARIDMPGLASAASSDWMHDLGYEAFAELGWLKSDPKENGWVDVRCPWEHEHVGGDRATGTAYTCAGGDGEPDFKCHHAHCHDRRWRSHVLPLFTEMEETRHVVHEMMFPPLDDDEQEKVDSFTGPADAVVEGNLLDELRARLPAYARQYQKKAKFDARVYDDAARNAPSLIRARIINGFQRDIATMIQAKPSAGKSAYMINVSLAITYRRPDLIGFPENMEMDFTGDVVLVSNEDSHEEVKSRLQAAERLFELDPKDQKHKIHIVADSNITLMRRTADGTLKPSCKSLLKHLVQIADKTEIALVSIDTLASAINGISENSNDEMQEVMNFLRDLSSAAFASMVIVHHTSKAGAVSENPDMYHARGASSVTGAIRSGLAMSGPNDQDRIAYGWNDEQAEAFVKIGRVKGNYDAPTRGLKWFRWETMPVHALDPRADTGELTMKDVGVLVPHAPTAVAGDTTRHDEWVQQVADAIEEHGAVKTTGRSENIPGTDIAAVWGLRQKNARERLNLLLGAGRLSIGTVRIGNYSAQVVQIVPAEEDAAVF